MVFRTYLNFIIGIYFAVVLWWLSLFLSGTNDVSVINAFSATWTLLGLCMCIPLFYYVKKVIKSSPNSLFIVSTFFIAIGIVLWCFGNAIWVFYNIFFQVNVPFPSYADILFLGCLPFFVYGNFVLLKQCSKKFITSGKLIIKGFVFCLCCVLLFTSTLYLLKNELLILRFLINFLIVSSDIINIFLITTFIFKSLVNAVTREKFTIGRLILSIGLLFQLISDLGFWIATSLDVYTNAGLVDLFYLNFVFLTLFSLFRLTEETYPPILGGWEVAGPQYLIKLSYLKQISLNCIRHIYNYWRISIFYLIFK